MVHAILEDLHAAADTAAAAGAALREVDVSTPFSDAGAGLPGSATAQACLWLGTRLGAAMQVYADDVTALGDAARRVALDLRSTDDAVCRELGGS